MGVVGRSVKSINHFRWHSAQVYRHILDQAVASLLAAGLAGCKVDLADDRLSITAANVEDAPLEFSASGHPVIDVTAFGDLSLAPPPISRHGFRLLHRWRQRVREHAGGRGGAG